MTSGAEEKCLAASSEAAVMAEWSAAPPEMQTESQEGREDTRMFYDPHFLFFTKL